MQSQLTLLLEGYTPCDSTERDYLSRVMTQRFLLKSGH